MRQSESETPAVPKRATQGVNPPERSWSWVEVSVWNERMLAALDNGVKGGKWLSWPNAFFAELGLFTMAAARALACQPR